MKVLQLSFDRTCCVVVIKKLNRKLVNINRFSDKAIPWGHMAVLLIIKLKASLIPKIILSP